MDIGAGNYKSNLPLWNFASPAYRFCVNSSKDIFVGQQTGQLQKVTSPVQKLPAVGRQLFW